MICWEKKEIKNFLKNTIELMVRKEREQRVWDAYYLNLEGDNAIVIEWESGFGYEKRDDVNQLPQNLDYGLVYSLKKINPKDRDVEWWDSMKTRDGEDACSYSIPPLRETGEEEYKYFDSLTGEIIEEDKYFDSLTDEIINYYNSLDKDDGREM